MLLFWRKRRNAWPTSSNGQTTKSFNSSHDTRKTIILFLTLHVYIVLCALAFQKVEYVESKTKMPNLKGIAANMSQMFNITGNRSMELVSDILNAAKLDTKVGMNGAWNEFSKAFWFVTILFTTVGTGHIVPTTFEGRLLAILTGLIGIPLYALFLKHFGECILYVNKRMLGLLENCSFFCKKGSYKNTKIVFLSFLEMALIIFLGALGAIPFDWPYFDGIYFCFISLSTVGFGDMIPDISGDRKFYGVIYMFYNIIGLAFVSCFICSVVNAIDDFNTMRQAVNWAARSLRPSGYKTRSSKKKGPKSEEEIDQEAKESRLRSNGFFIDRMQLRSLSTSDAKVSTQEVGLENKAVFTM